MNSSSPVPFEHCFGGHGYEMEASSPYPCPPPELEQWDPDEYYDRLNDHVAYRGSEHGTANS